jgi:glycosyltransferase involved in cell wall biosynthesis
MLEAMSAGCAVIATEVGEDGAALGDAGMRIPSSPLEPHLRDALETLRNDDSSRVAFGLRARARVAEHYGLQGNLDHVLDIYRRLRIGAAAA